MFKPRSFCLCLLMLTACAGSGGDAQDPGTAGATSETAASTASGRPEGRVVDGCFVTDDAPPPLACDSDADCTAGGLLDGSRCCMRGVTHAHSRAYHSWQTGYFREHCDTSCMDPPAPPTDCQMAVSCVEGACQDACD